MGPGTPAAQGPGAVGAAPGGNTPDALSSEGRNVTIISM